MRKFRDRRRGVAFDLTGEVRLGDVGDADGLFCLIGRQACAFGDFALRELRGVPPLPSVCWFLPLRVELLQQFPAAAHGAGADADGHLLKLVVVGLPARRRFYARRRRCSLRHSAGP